MGIKGFKFYLEESILHNWKHFHLLLFMMNQEAAIFWNLLIKLVFWAFQVISANNSFLQISHAFDKVGHCLKKRIVLCLP